MIAKLAPVAPDVTRPLSVALVEDDPLLRGEVELHLKSRV